MLKRRDFNGATRRFLRLKKEEWGTISLFTVVVFQHYGICLFFKGVLDGSNICLSKMLWWCGEEEWRRVGLWCLEDDSFGNLVVYMERKESSDF